MRTAETIAIDLPCLGCGYNLRTLPFTGVCPECAAPVAASREAFETRSILLVSLRRRGLAWLAEVRRAVALAAIANVAAFAIGLLYRWPYPPYVSTQTWVWPVLWLAPPLAVFVVGCWASWRLAALMLPRHAASVARGAIACMLVGLALLFLNPRWLRFYFDLNWLTADRIEAVVLQYARGFGAILLMLGWPASLGLATFAAARLAWLCRWRALSVGVGGVGLVLSVGLGVLLLTALPTSSGLDRAGSGELMFNILGPSGTLPTVGSMTYDLRLRRAEDLIGVAVYGLIATLIAWPLFLLRPLTRAIRLGELPAASSHSSPSPRPPA